MIKDDDLKNRSLQTSIEQQFDRVSYLTKRISTEPVGSHISRFAVLFSVVIATLRRTPAKRSEWLVPVGFTALIHLTYVVGLAIGTVINGEPTLPQVVYQPILFPGLFTVAPVVLAATNTLRGASLASNVAVGVAPGLAFLLLAWGAELAGVSSGGDAPAWGLAVMFAVVGLGGALFGTGIVVATRILRRRMEAGE